jgi:hypothetical protein
MELDVAPTEPEWATDIVQYLKNGLLPEDKTRARKTNLQETCSEWVTKWVAQAPPEVPSKTKAEYVMKEIHEGV